MMSRISRYLIILLAIFVASIFFWICTGLVSASLFVIRLYPTVRSKNHL